MKKNYAFLLITSFFSFVFLLHPPLTMAQIGEPNTSDYFRAKVTEILEQEKFVQSDGEFYTQKVKLERVDTNEVITTTVGSQFQPLNQNQLLKVGKTMILSKQVITPDQTEYVIVDVYRNTTILWLFGVFCLAVITVAHWQGLFSIVGMFISLAVLTNIIIPQILDGSDPIIVTLIGSLIIGSITIYLSHGWSIKSHLALSAIMATLVLVAFLAYVSVQSAQIVGLGSEEAYFLQFGSTAKINLQGLLLGGIMLGALGILDDITVSQVSIVFQLKALKKDISFFELYSRALHVGKDHVSSLVNTLVLAYAGANLPLFLLFTINQQVPHWVTFNSEIILEEVIRTLTGSIGLVMAVPLTTAMASYVAIRHKGTLIKNAHKHHH